MKRKKLLILSIIVFIMGIVFLKIICIIKNKNDEYQIKNETYYEVTLNSDSYFVNNKIDANNYYIAKAIKSIDIYFNYNLKKQPKKNINYAYDITATLKSYADNGTKLIWTKDFNLKNVKDINQEEINIQEDYNLDYQYYVNYVKSFSEYYKIKTETYLYVKLNIKINDMVNPYVLLTIPVNEDVIEITLNEDESFLKNNEQTKDFYEVIIFLVIVVIIIILKSKANFNKNNEKAILKRYQDIIINIKNKPNITNNDIIYLTDLKSLVNIAIDNNVNILNYLLDYYVIITNTCYIYHLKCE